MEYMAIDEFADKEMSGKIEAVSSSIIFRPLILLLLPNNNIFFVLYLHSKPIFSFM